MVFAKFTIFDLINSLSQLGTFLVVIATAVAGIAQLRHLRASNELEALLRLTEQLREPDMQTALGFVQRELEAKLRDPAYRAELAHIGFIDSRQHPEMDACNWFNEVGALVKGRLIDERIFLDLFARLVSYYWMQLQPVIAILRRERGPSQYENFEFLARLALTWKSVHPTGAYPARVDRMAVEDLYAAIDAQPQTPAASPSA
jgi:hypothetical protein